MKIVCQSCGKNYKIADEKVQGKKAFKIKCKNCGADILVRGLDTGAVEPPPEEEATRAMSTEAAMGLAGLPEAEGIWHAVVQGEQQGPYTVAQLQEMMATGAIDAETYVWRDGFDGWLPLREVGELSAVTEGGSDVAMLSGAMPMGEPEPPLGDDLFGGSTVAQPSPLSSEPPPSMAKGNDLFGADASARVSSVSVGGAEAARTRAAAKSSAGDLFAAEARAQEAAKPLFVEEPKAPTGEHLTGQRNENSVLFSLATLQQLSGNEAPEASAGTASGDSSGLIDINKLAGAISNNRPSSKRSGVDDILSVGTTGGLNSPLAAPILAPIALAAAPVVPAAPVEPARPQAGSKTTMVTAIAVASILGVTGIAAAFILKGRGEGDPNTVAANTAAPAASATTGQALPEAAPTPPPAAPAAPGAPEAPAAPAAPAAAEAPSEGPSNSAGAPNRPREHRERDRDRPSAAARTAPAAAPTPAPAARPAPAAPAAPARRPGGASSIDDLMNAVGGGGAPARPAAAAPGASAPSGGAGGTIEPNRSAVQAALRAVGPSVRNCGTGSGGVATVTLVFNQQGRVNTANVGPPHAGTPVGSCVARAAREAQIPPFNSRPTLSVTFPYPLQ